MFSYYSRLICICTIYSIRERVFMRNKAWDVYSVKRSAYKPFTPNVVAARGRRAGTAKETTKQC